ncbi:anti-sigma factor domain-containing protein [Nocardia sp. NPDC052566]|uniref:anti-sigma factor n=1 Tax=Nocardia sp. NPDC052566 TaxID=3364330 RepID=UPI0037C8DDC9
MTTSPDIHGHTGAYVLDALGLDERAAFERHLAGCPACLAEVDGLRSVAAVLAAAVAPIPAAAMKERVLEQIRSHRQLPADRPGALERTALLPALDALGRTDVMPALEFDRDPPHDRRWWTTRIAVAAAAAAVVALFAGLAMLDRAPTGPGTSVALEQVRRARDATTRDGVVVAGGGSASAVLSHSVGKVVVSANGLPVLDDSHSYQLWIIPGDGTPQSAGMMSTTGQRTELVADLPDDTRLLAITAEPDVGSPGPTTPIVVKIDLS